MPAHATRPSLPRPERPRPIGRHSTHHASVAATARTSCPRPVPRTKSVLWPRRRGSRHREAPRNSRIRQARALAPIQFNRPAPSRDHQLGPECAVANVATVHGGWRSAGSCNKATMSGATRSVVPARTSLPGGLPPGDDHGRRRGGPWATPEGAEMRTTTVTWIWCRAIWM